MTCPEATVLEELATSPDELFSPTGILVGQNINLLFEMLREGAYCVDRERRIHHWNGAAEKITGYHASEVVGTHCFADILQHIDGEGRQLCACDEHCPLFLTICDGLSREARVSLLHKNGTRVPVAIKSIPLVDSDGQFIGAVELFHEDGIVESLQEQLAHMEKKAHIDCLTGLPNRHGIEIRLRHSLDEWERYGWPFACFIADIDYFKRINDTCGHDVGDQAISTVMNTLAMACRTSDYVGRWGGDESVGILENVDADELHAQLQRMNMMIRNTAICRETLDISATISIGATVVLKGDTPQSILKRADSALYTCKVAGRDGYVIA